MGVVGDLYQCVGSEGRQSALHVVQAAVGTHAPMRSHVVLNTLQDPRAAGQLACKGGKAHAFTVRSKGTGGKGTCVTVPD